MGRRTKRGFKRKIKKGKWGKTHGYNRRDMERLLRAARDGNSRVIYDPS